MKKIIIFLVAAIFLGCNEEKKETAKLPGEFKYTAYNWNDSRDSIGLNLMHHLQISKDGNYKLVERNDAGDASYYYGFIGFDRIGELSSFMSDTLNSTDSNRVKRGMNYLFDYPDATGKDKKVKFTAATATPVLEKTRLLLDSVLADPNRKPTSFFNIDEYLRQIAFEDMATSK